MLMDEKFSFSLLIPKRTEKLCDMVDLWFPVPRVPFDRVQQLIIGSLVVCVW